MIFQGEENDGINIILIGAALFIISVICGMAYAVYRLYRRSRSGTKGSAPHTDQPVRITPPHERQRRDT